MKTYIKALLLILFMTQSLVLPAQTETGSLFTLENGLNIYIRPMRANPVVSLNLWVKVGSVNEEGGQEGYAHLLERMLFRGSQRFPFAALENEIRATGAKHTSFTANDYTTVAITGASLYFEKLVELLTETVFNSAIDAKDLGQEAKAVIEEINASTKNPNIYITQLMMEEAFKVHPYRHPVIGYRAVIEQVTREKIVEFYKKYYVPANCWLIVTGDVDPMQAVEIIKKYAGSVAKAAAPTVSIPQEPPQKGMRIRVEQGDVQNTFVRLGWRVPGVESVDKYALYVVARMIGGGTASWLWKEMVVEQQIAASAGAGYYSSQFPMLFQVGGVTTPGKARQFVEVARRIVARLIDGEITQEEIEAAKQQIIADDIFGRETAENQAANLGHFAMLSDIADAETFADNIRQVNLEDIRRVATEYLNDNNLTIAKFEPRTASDDAPPEMITLDNGVRLILKENHSAPVVSVVAKIAAGGLREEKKQAGLANLTAEMLVRGSRRFSGSEIADTFAAMGTKYSSQTSKSFVSFNLQTLAENFQKSLDLFVDILVDPDFQSSELDKLKTQVEESLQLEEQDIYKFTSQQALMGIFPDTPIGYSNIGTIDDVKKIKRQDLTEFHSRHYVGGNTVIAIVGDFYIREMKEALLSAFGRFSSTSPREMKKLELKEIKEPLVLNLKKNVEQAQVVIANRTLPASDEKSIAMEIAQTILSGGPASKLIASLRDRDSVAFSSWAYNAGMANTGYFLATAITAPPLASQATEGLKKEIELFNQNGFTPDEFERAKKFLVGQYSLSLADNLALADNAASDELLGKGFDFYRRYPQILASTTPELVKSVSSELIMASGSYAIVVTTP